jgi:dynein heavy chain
VLCEADTRKRLLRAERLTDSLASERARWAALAVDLGERRRELPGTMLLCAACVAYLGPLDAAARASLTSLWCAELASRGLPVGAGSFADARAPAAPSASVPMTGTARQLFARPAGGPAGGGGFALAGCLLPAVTAREWRLCGLPVDGRTSDSALIVTRARRWPLLVDPQQVGA